ncbi:MAG: hypothetical protein KME64_28825 [Scytonematopsis contorta HA4267-MV1]|nr:hypothetical protein [Scytonematopsis contorta HA4267-MV1]
MGSREWGVGSGVRVKNSFIDATKQLPIPNSQFPTPHSPLPTPHSPLPTPHSPGIV